MMSLDNVVGVGTHPYQDFASLTEKLVPFIDAVCQNSSIHSLRNPL